MNWTPALHLHILELFTKALSSWTRKPGPKPSCEEISDAGFEHSLLNSHFLFFFPLVKTLPRIYAATTWQKRPTLQPGCISAAATSFDLQARAVAMHRDTTIPKGCPRPQMPLQPHSHLPLCVTAVSSGALPRHSHCTSLKLQPLGGSSRPSSGLGLKMFFSI